ncbi:hypothetical protein BJX66DRAFT_301701, partial [Aspergillus keveii]
MNLVLFTAKWCPKISCCRIAHAVLSENYPANVGECILKENKGNKLDDIRALGALLVSLKEPGTSGRKPGTLQLEKPNEVSDICNDFLSSSSRLSAESLLKVSSPANEVTLANKV